MNNFTKEFVEDVFNNCDQSGSGFINIKKLKIVMRALGLEPRQEEVKQMTTRMLENKAARSINPEAFNVEELYNLLVIRLEKSDEADEIRCVFKFFDLEDKGYITINDLRRVANELCESITEDDLKEMVNVADISKKGRVYPAEFKDIMKKISLY